MMRIDPTKTRRGAKRFVEYFLLDLAQSLNRRGLLALVPWKFIICAAVGAAVGVYVEPTIFTDRGVAVAVFSALLTFNAILFAVCWGAFGRIYDILREDGFGDWLREKRMTGYYEFYVEFIQLTQMLASVAAGVGLALVVVQVPTAVMAGALGVAVACAAYAVWWTTGCVHVMQDLFEQRGKWVALRRGKPVTESADG